MFLHLKKIKNKKIKKKKNEEAPQFYLYKITDYKKALQNNKILKYKAIAVTKTAKIERASKFISVSTNNRDPAKLNEVEGRGDTNAETSNYKNLEE